MNTAYRKLLEGTPYSFFDARAAVDAITPGAYDQLPYTSKVLAENLVRRCDPSVLTDSLKQIIDRKRDLDFPGIRLVSSAMTFLDRPHSLIWRAYAMPLQKKAETPHR